ncbi:MAG: heme o synthase [Planctomycetota bacterium]|nr:heme o synthase [Planctomycetota bacterium]
MDSIASICDLPDTAIGGPLGVEAGARSTSKGTSVSRSRDFYELIKPRMNMLILGTTMVGYFMATQIRSDWLRLPHALLGTALCAAGAAILNQLVERRHDALMPRTARRPLPTGRVSPREAMALGLLCGILGTFYLWLMVNTLTAILGGATLASYVLIYTPLKRLTTLNTIVGAIPGALPPVMGWTAVTGSISHTTLALFAILFIWQIPHFLAIAILYRDDYRLGGFKMLPVNDPALKATGRQILLYSAALLPISFLPVVFHASGEIYGLSAVVLGSIFFYYALSCALGRTRLDARKLFFASIIYLPVLLTIMMLNRTQV